MRTVTSCVTYLAALLLLMGFFLVHRVPQPSLLVASTSGIRNASISAGSWYWISDASQTQSTLSRLENGSVRQIATDERITEYSVNSRNVAWISRKGATWSVHTATVNGDANQTVWTGTSEPKGVYLIDNSVFWLSSDHELAPGIISLPPIGMHADVYQAQIPGGVPVVHNSVPEADAERILGMFKGDLLVLANRAGVRGATVVYRVNPNAGKAYRIIGEAGKQDAVLSHGSDESIYWTAPGRDASNPSMASCVRRIPYDGPSQELADWLPGGGRVFSTRSGPVYIDGAFEPVIWRVGDSNHFPAQIPVAKGFTPIAAGENEILLRPSGVFSGSYPLYRMRLN